MEQNYEGVGFTDHTTLRLDRETYEYRKKSTHPEKYADEMWIVDRKALLQLLLTQAKSWLGPGSY